ncbi:MAG TPA: maleylacetoacetate isomerase [Polyangia bacterium]|nr:maleylacetoacetate isomerase [Polyangia bacterium]
MIFYDYWRSSSAWRVRLALHLKGISFERRPVNLLADEQHAPEFRALNPQGQVPVLVIPPETPAAGPQVLTQSMAILGYLEERFPAPPLLPPPDALVARARARQLAEMVNSGIQPFQNMSLFAWLRGAGVADPSAVAREFNARGLAAVEELARETAGKFLVGDVPTIADVYLTPQLYGARRLGVDLAPYPTLLRVEAAAAALPAFAAARPERQADAVPANP